MNIIKNYIFIHCTVHKNIKYIKYKQKNYIISLLALNILNVSPSLF